MSVAIDRIFKTPFTRFLFYAKNIFKKSDGDIIFNHVIYLILA